VIIKADEYEDLRLHKEIYNYSQNDINILNALLHGCRTACKQLRKELNKMDEENE